MNTNEKSIMEIIKENPYITQKEIGEELDLPRSTVATIISNLTQKNLIKGRAYILNEVHSEVFVIGGMNVDRKYTLDDTLELKTSNPVSSESFVGGVGRNIAENLGRLGHKVFMISLAGFDQDYEFIKKNSSGFIDFRYVKQIPDYATGAYSAILNKDGEMEIAIADMNIYDQMDLDFVKSYNHILKDAKLIVMDLNIPKESVEYIINFAKINNIKLVIIPVSSPKINRLPKNLDGVSYIIVNQDESEKYFDIKINSDEDFEKLANMWIESGVEEVVVTRGKSSSFYKNKDGITKEVFPPITENVIDVTGAGDSFSAGIIHGILEELEFDETLELGMTNSYYTIQSKNTVRDNLNRENINIEKNNLKSKGIMK